MGMIELYASKVGDVEGAMRWVWIIAEGVGVGCVMGVLH